MSDSNSIALTSAFYHCRVGKRSLTINVMTHEQSIGFRHIVSTAIIILVTGWNLQAGTVPQISNTGVCRALTVQRNTTALNLFSLSITIDPTHPTIALPGDGVKCRLMLDIEGNDTLDSVLLAGVPYKQLRVAKDGYLREIDIDFSFQADAIWNIIDQLNQKKSVNLELDPADQGVNCTVRSALLMLWYGPQAAARPVDQQPDAGQGTTRALAFRAVCEDQVMLTRYVGPDGGETKIPTLSNEYFGRLQLDFDKPELVDHIDILGKHATRIDAKPGDSLGNPIVVEFSFKQGSDAPSFTDLISDLNKGGELVTIGYKDPAQPAQMIGALLSIWAFTGTTLSGNGSSFALDNMQPVGNGDIITVKDKDGNALVGVTLTRNNASLKTEANGNISTTAGDPVKNLKTLLAHVPGGAPLTVDQSITLLKLEVK